MGLIIFFLFFCSMINFKIFNRLILSLTLSTCTLSLAQSENLIINEDSLISKLMLVKKEIDRDSYESQYSFQMKQGIAKLCKSSLKSRSQAT